MQKYTDFKGYIYEHYGICIGTESKLLLMK
jgi:hypothetical protein